MGQFIEVLDNPEVAFNKLMDSLPIALFFLLPVYAVLLKLFYWGSNRFYVEHLVFSVYLHIVSFLILTVIMLMPGEGEPFSSIASILQLAFLVYYFLALKRYYGQGGWTTTVKFGGLLASYSIMLLPGLLLVMAATFTFL
jgi:hypothetical protein